ncbi:hypothetical protein [Nocardia thailandica]|uniref:hypothetical protein n=1 Tax=Nocardia thailandica TaxID=257275 RepID=UPI0002EB55F0|nr:hypothetical protein [Nocardia thailandica]
MCSNPIVWRLGSTTGLDPSQLYRVRGGWASPSPAACPAGHSLGPNRVIVGSVMCPDVPGTGCHRSYRCRTCDAVILWPPETASCVHRPFDGRYASGEPNT